jgi:nucleoside-diphosphate-sugar epimerase
MRALVTGGTGFLGSYLVRAWARRFGPESVTCLVPPKGTPAEMATQEAFLHEGLRCVPGDLCRCPVAEGLDGQYDVVFHLAAATDTSWPEERLAPVNVQGTRNLLESLRGRLRGTRIVFTSTSAAVDRERRPAGPLTEESPCCPRTAYGRTKRDAERILKEFCAGEQATYTIARLTTLYGPGVRTGLIPVLADGLRSGKLAARLEWPGRVSLLFIDDAVSCLTFLAECPAAANETFFLSSGECPRVGEIVRGVAERVRAPRKPLALPGWTWALARGIAWTPGMNRLIPWRLLHILDDGLWCDNGKFVRVSGHRFVGWEEGLTRTFAAEARPQEILPPKVESVTKGAQTVP